VTERRLRTLEALDGDVAPRSGIVEAAARAYRLNDRFCRSAAELRMVILNARAIALEEAQRERAAVAFKRQLLAGTES
jgi:hypothetical protein